MKSKKHKEKMNNVATYKFSKPYSRRQLDNNDGIIITTINDDDGDDNNEPKTAASATPTTPGVDVSNVGNIKEFVAGKEQQKTLHKHCNHLVKTS